MEAAELVAWQARNGLRNDADAAAAIGVSAVTYRRKRTGVSRITRPTELLCAYHEALLNLDPMRLAELNEVIAKLIRLRVFAR